MAGEEWFALMEKLASITGSSRCLEYEACPMGGLVVNIDGYSISGSLLPWMDLSDWGWKATVAAASDVIASGGRPAGVMYSVGLGDVGDVEMVAAGVAEASKYLGAQVLKSDTNRSGGEGWIDVSVIGPAERPIARSGASPGDLVIQVGYVGFGLVAEAVLRGKASIDDYRAVKLHTRRPRLPLIDGRPLSSCGATSASDNSDGWGHTLLAISRYSGVGISIEKVLAPGEVWEYIGSSGLGEEELFNSWEDYSIAVTAGGEEAECILSECSRVGAACEVVGEVTGGRGVKFRGRMVIPRSWTWH